MLFSFSVHFSKMSSRRQAKLITIHRIPGFSFFISFRFQCNTCFQYAISCFAKAYRNNFASNFWQVAVCGIHMSKSFTGYHILLMELFLCPRIEWSGAYWFCPVCLSVYLSVVNFNLRFNFWTVRDWDFIYSMRTPLMMPFQMTPRSITLWPWLWPWN